MHWRVRPDVLRICGDFEFRPVLIVRHPLDVLISVLHFCTFEPATRHWLNGESGDETAIYGKDPGDAAFAAYATGPRAAALLAVSVEWMRRGAPWVRFEDLVARPEIELAAFLKQLPATPVRPLAEVIDANTLEKSRPTANNQHFWQGQPGIWTRLIGKELAARIQRAHADVFQSLGYGIGEAGTPAPEEIRRLWSTIA